MDTSMTDDILHQAAVAAMLVHVMQFAKRVPGFAWLQDPTIAKIVAFVLVMVGSVGVKFQMTGTFHDGGQIVLAWPMASVMMDAIEHIFLQWVLQEGYYQKFVKEAKP
jgi:hypothetical protein